MYVFFGSHQQQLRLRMKVNILAQTPDGKYQQYGCDMMGILHAAPGQWRTVTDDGMEC